MGVFWPQWEQLSQKRRNRYFSETRKSVWAGVTQNWRREKESRERTPLMLWSWSYSMLELEFTEGGDHLHSLPWGSMSSTLTHRDWYLIHMWWGELWVSHAYSGRVSNGRQECQSKTRIQWEDPVNAGASQWCIVSRLLYVIFFKFFQEEWKNLMEKQWKWKKERWKKVPGRDLMYSMVFIVNNMVLYIWHLPGEWTLNVLTTKKKW